MEVNQFTSNTFTGANEMNDPGTALFFYAMAVQRMRRLQAQVWNPRVPHDLAAVEAAEKEVDQLTETLLLPEVPEVPALEGGAP